MNHEEIKAKLLDRIKIEPGPLETPCWIWQLSCDSKGYGQIKIDHKYRRAHRIAYEAFNGAIPNGLHVLHICHQPACCNPAHLYAGTQQQNMDDMVAAGRHYGHRKLTEKEVAWIKFWLSQDYSTAVIGIRYDVATVSIRDIKNGKRWTDVEIENPEDCPEEFYPSEARWPLVPVLGLRRI